MNNYKIGRVYKIIHNQSNIFYIGSTFSELRNRFQYHSYENNKCSIYPYIKKYGIKNFKIILIKEYKVFDKLQLLSLEQLWMNKLKPINNRKSFQPLKNDHNKQYMVGYYENNKEIISVKSKLYRDNNIEKIILQSKNYRENHKEEIKEKKSEKFNCDCGGTWTKGHGFKRHEKTIKHKKFIGN